MAKYLTEMEELQAALARCNLSEEVLPTKNGFLIENLECYKKIKKMLECDELEASHRFLFNLDPDEITQGDQEKVDKLYNLACDRGFIQPQQDDYEVDGINDGCDEDPVATDMSQDYGQQSFPVAQSTEQPVSNQGNASSPFSVATQSDAFVVMYSACTTDGKIKTGEVYSNASDPQGAKADAIKKLQDAGYHSISILCVEAGDPDACGADDNVYDKTSDVETTSLDEEDLDETVNNSEDPESFFKNIDGSQSTPPPQPKDDDDSDEDSEDSEDDEEESTDEAEEEEKDSKEDNEDKEASDDDSSNEETNDEESSNGDEEGSEEDDEVEEPKDDKANDNSDDGDDSESDDKDAEDTEDDEESDSDDEKLSAEDKEKFKKEYTDAWKETLVAIKAKTPFSQFDLPTKVKFFEKLAKKWGDKPSSDKFLSDKDNVAIEKTAPKK